MEHMFASHAHDVWKVEISLFEQIVRLAGSNTDRAKDRAEAGRKISGAHILTKHEDSS